MIKWGLSVVDFHSHAIEDHGNHPSGVYLAQCGHRLLSTTPLREAPAGRFVCQICRDSQLSDAQRAGAEIHSTILRGVAVSGWYLRTLKTATPTGASTTSTRAPSPRTAGKCSNPPR
ncbi:MAG: hypothetical protein ACRDSH_19235 [Pseudonocardiaceae bacterium]